MWGALAAPNLQISFIIITSELGLKTGLQDPCRCVLGCGCLAPPFLPAPYPEPSLFPHGLSSLRVVRGPPDSAMCSASEGASRPAAAPAPSNVNTAPPPEGLQGGKLLPTVQNLNHVFLPTCSSSGAVYSFRSRSPLRLLVYGVCLLLCLLHTDQELHS